MYKKICKYCGKEFNGDKESRKFCSVECRAKFRKEEVAKQKIGEINYTKQGIKMVIVGYRNIEDIDVQFEDDKSVVYNTRYSDFKRRNIKHPLKKEDSLAYKYPQIAKMIAIEENGLTFKDCCGLYPHSSKKFYVKCPNCNRVSNKKMELNYIVEHYSCNYCSDGISIPEKFMINILNQLNVNYIYQLSKKDFSWCNSFMYDFYIPKHNMIIEVHGKQHYEHKSHWGKEYKLIFFNDRYKKHLAKENGIKRYYPIDCKYSEFEYMKSNIIKTLGYLFDLSNIDWELAWRESQKSIIIRCWELYKNGICDTNKLSYILKVSKTTVLKYLKLGAECGEINYVIGNKGIKNGSSKMYKVIDNNGNCNIMSKTEIYNKGKNKRGFLNISFNTFEKYIAPYSIVDSSKVTSKNTRKKLEPFDGWQIIKIEKEEAIKYE